MCDQTADIETILAEQHRNGGDYWASADSRIYVGNPYSTIGALALLRELGVTRKHEAVSGGIDCILAAIRDDGRIRIAPGAPLYPCYTAEALRVLCRFGLAEDTRVQQVFDYLLNATHDSGGWRCSFSRFGKGEETRCASPGATLYALDALRFLESTSEVEAAVLPAIEFLLGHWQTRQPIGPCHHGIGSRFLKIEYPFYRYNVFYYGYVLSFFDAARRDTGFKKAIGLIESRSDENGLVVPQSTHPGLRDLSFCRAGRPSASATARLEEIHANLE